MLIRDEQTNDIERVTKIQYAAFKGHPMHPPGSEPVEQRIVELLRAKNALTLSLLAEEDGVAAGHIAISPAVVGACAEGWHLLGPVGVVPERQGRGIGTALIRETLSRMRESGSLGLVLVGDPAFYGRFGFRSMEGLTYTGVPGQYVLALPFTEALSEGEIIAHEAFRAPHA